MTTTYTNIETVTRSQIRSLLAEAQAAGDTGQVDLCTLALGHWSDQPAFDGEGEAIAAALAECVRVIADTEAQGHASPKQIAAIKRLAFNDVTRTIADEGVRLTWAQRDDLGDTRIAWLTSRLGLVATTDDDGVTFAPPTQ